MREIARQTGGRILKSDLLPITTGHPLCCFCANFLREPDGRITSMMTQAQREDGLACCDDAGLTGCCDGATLASGCDDAASAGCCDGAILSSGCDDAALAGCCDGATLSSGCDDAALAGCCDDRATMGDFDESSCDCCASALDPLEIVRRDRDFVLNKWTVGEAFSGKEVLVPTEEAFFGKEDSVIAGDGVPGADASCSDLKDSGRAASDVMNLDEALLWFRGNMFTISGMAFMDRSNLDAERLKRCRVQYFTPDERLIPFCAYNTMYRGNL
jgi:hypothetical protein